MDPEELSRLETIQIYLEETEELLAFLNEHSTEQIQAVRPQPPGAGDAAATDPDAGASNESSNDPGIDITDTSSESELRNKLYHFVRWGEINYPERLPLEKSGDLVLPETKAGIQDSEGVNDDSNDVAASSTEPTTMTHVNVEEAEPIITGNGCCEKCVGTCDGVTSVGCDPMISQLVERVSVHCQCRVETCEKGNQTMASLVYPDNGQDEDK